MVGGDGRSGVVAEMAGAGRMAGPERRGGCAGAVARDPAAWGRRAGASGVAGGGGRRGGARGRRRRGGARWR